MQLNKEELFVQRIIDWTENDRLKWKVSKFSRFSGEIENSNNGIRLFESDSLENIAPQNNSFMHRKFIAYEIKDVVYHNDLENFYEANSIVLMLLHDFVKEQVYDSSTISKEILSNLIETISNKTFKTSSFMDSLMSIE